MKIFQDIENRITYIHTLIHSYTNMEDNTNNCSIKNNLCSVQFERSKRIYKQEGSEFILFEINLLSSI